MIQHLCKTTAKLWHNVLAGAILSARALWLLQMMRTDRASIHSHPCVPASSERGPVAQSSPDVTASTAPALAANATRMLEHRPLLRRAPEHVQHRELALLPRAGLRRA